MKNITTPFIIGFSVPKRLERKAVVCSEILKTKGGLYVLDGDEYVPHITVYRGEFPVHAFDRILSELTLIAKNTEQWNLRATQYRQNTHGYVDVAYATSVELRSLQKRIVSALNPLRDGLLCDTAKEDFNKVGALQQNNFRKYGYDYVGRNFVPHLTFTKFDAFTPGAENTLPKYDFSFMLNSITLFRQGVMNTSSGICAQFRFK